MKGRKPLPKNRAAQALAELRWSRTPTASRKAQLAKVRAGKVAKT